MAGKDGRFPLLVACGEAFQGLADRAVAMPLSSALNHTYADSSSLGSAFNLTNSNVPSAAFPMRVKIPVSLQPGPNIT
jgi:hypothetical protein